MSETLRELENLLKKGWSYRPRKEAFHGAGEKPAGNMQTVTMRYKDKLKEAKIPQHEVSEAKKLFEQYGQQFPGTTG